ncbi:MAG: dihydropyrimidinase [Nitrospinota bacterium]
MDLLLKNGTVVTPQGPVPADLGVRGEVITYIGRPGLGEGIRPRKTLDCSGCLLLPGVIDAHVQLEVSFGFGDLLDDFRSGSRAAACGGVTTLIDYARQRKGGSPLEALRCRKEAADAKVGIDYTLHLTLIDPTPEALAEAPRALDEGIRSFKVYMAYGKAGRRTDDGAILALMRVLSEAGGLLGIHAEVDEHIIRATEDLIRSGKTHPRYHGRAHPPISEVAAVEALVRMSRESGCEIYIKHVSTAEAASLIGKARGEGLAVWGETCPHYLLLDESRYAGEAAPLFIMSPPLRSEDNREALWAALAAGDLQIVATDHASYSRAQKFQSSTTFEGVPPGVPGIETLLPLGYTYGVGKRRLSLHRLAQVLAEEPARVFGLYPKKGVLQVGADADLVVYDPAPKGVIDASKLAMNVDFSPFEGMAVQGRVRETFCRGRLVARRGRWAGEEHWRGRFVPIQPVQPSTGVRKS